MTDLKAISYESLILGKTKNISSFKSMVYHAVENMVFNIAVPLLRSGCDDLDFLGKVLRLIEHAIGNSKINIHIYYLMKYALMLTLNYKLC